MSEIDPQQVVGDEANDPPKSAKQLEKEAKKAAKLQKLQEKIDKKSTAVPSTKDKAEVSFQLDFHRKFKHLTSDNNSHTEKATERVKGDGNLHS